jgi:hypothetical protein
MKERPLDFGALWERSNPPVISDSLLNRLIHDAELDAGWGDGPEESMVPLVEYNEGVVSALRELRERRSHG